MLKLSNILCLLEQGEKSGDSANVWFKTPSVSTPINVLCYRMLKSVYWAIYCENTSLVSGILVFAAKNIC